jgi:Icc-related predicted phosphoesterase
LQWFSQQHYTYKIFISGNHDFFLEECTATKRKKLLPAGIIYLQNSGVVIEGLKIWGSPVTPYFLGMAFNERTGTAIKKVWSKIPADTNILITHGPPKGILDGGIGCDELLNQVNKIKPMVHCFGHAHGYNGIEKTETTTFVNTAMVNTLNPLLIDEYKMVGKAIKIKI